MSKITVPPGGHVRHEVEIGESHAVLRLRDYQGKPSWDSANSRFPHGVEVEHITPWDRVESDTLREIVLVERNTLDRATVYWQIGHGAAAIRLTLEPVPGAVRAAWDQAPNASSYQLQWLIGDETSYSHDKWGGRRQHIIEVGPEQKVTARVRATYPFARWSEEVEAVSGAWPRDPDRLLDAYAEYRAGRHWRAELKPCWYDRENLLDIEVWWDDPDDALEPALISHTVGLSPHSGIARNMWELTTPRQIKEYDRRADHGRSVAEAEINRQAAVLRNMRVRREIERSGI